MIEACIEQVRLSLAYRLGKLRASIRQMPEGPVKSSTLALFEERQARHQLDLMSPGPIRDAFLQGARAAERSPREQPVSISRAIEELEGGEQFEPKRIAFFADGTGNGFDVDQTGNRTGCDATNVLKMFRALDGNEWRDRNEAVRLLAEPGLFGRRQAAKYLHGVGNGENWLSKALSGATGRGLLERIIQGFTFLSRHHEPGARIVLAGFSRGAYTVRALADWIATKGLLDPEQFDVKDEARQYQLAAASLTAWQRYRASRFRQLQAEKKLKWHYFHGYENILMTLPSFFKVPEPRHVFAEVRCVAVWDTVGALGLWNPVPELSLLRRRQRRIRRPDTVLLTTPVLHKHVGQAWHAISLDEDRVDFTPSLWDPRDGIVQRLFPGVHADVGGGYEHCGLSDIALGWMHGRLQDLLLFREPVAVTPDPVAMGHRGWNSTWGALALRGARSFDHRNDLEVDDAVHDRITAAQVRAHSRAEPQPYRPSNLPVGAERFAARSAQASQSATRISR